MWLWCLTSQPGRLLVQCCESSRGSSCEPSRRLRLRCHLPPSAQVPKCSWGKNTASSRNAALAANSALSLAAALQGTHLGPASHAPLAAPQNVMASLAAAAAANAVAAMTAASHVPAAAASMPGYGPHLDAQHLPPALGTGPAHLPYSQGGPGAVPQGYLALPQAPRQAAPSHMSIPQNPACSLPGAGHAMMGGQFMYSQTHQVCVPRTHRIAALAAAVFAACCRLHCSVSDVCWCWTAPCGSWLLWCSNLTKP